MEKGYYVRAKQTSSSPSTMSQSTIKMEKGYYSSTVKW